MPETTSSGGRKIHSNDSWRVSNGNSAGIGKSPRVHGARFPQRQACCASSMMASGTCLHLASRSLGCLQNHTRCARVPLAARHNWHRSVGARPALKSLSSVHWPLHVEESSIDCCDDPQEESALVLNWASALKRGWEKIPRSSPAEGKIAWMRLTCHRRTDSRTAALTARGASRLRVHLVPKSSSQSMAEWATQRIRASVASVAVAGPVTADHTHLALASLSRASTNHAMKVSGSCHLSQMAVAQYPMGSS